MRERLEAFAREGHVENGIGATTAYRAAVAVTLINPMADGRSHVLPEWHKLLQARDAQGLPAEPARSLLPDALLSRLAASDSAPESFYSLRGEGRE